MSSRSHIVHFSAKSRNSEGLMEYQPLSIMIKKVQSICIDELEAKLVNMLNTADDRLFDMAETSYNNAQFDAMRLLRIKREGLIRSFKQELGNNFKQALGKIDSPSNQDDNIEELSFENIALVKDDDLEENIATDAMVNKAKTKNQNALEQIRIRIDTIVANKSVEQADNPFEPAYICDAFRTATLTLDLDIASLLVIYKLFDRSVFGELESLYQKINQFFIEKGILPELKTGPVQKMVNREGLTGQGNGSQSQDFQQSTPQLSDPIDSLPINEAYSAVQSYANNSKNQQKIVNQSENFSAIQQLLSESRTAQSGAYYDLSPSQNPNFDNTQSDRYSGQYVDTQQLLQTLSKLQINQRPSVPIAGQVQQVNLRESISVQMPQFVNSEEYVSLGQFNEDMIDVVSMLFDFILEDDNLQPELKSVIARLQIPMLKVGLVDKTFFSNKRHPARVLLNELAHAGLFWDEKDRSAQDMFEKISTTAERVIQEFSNDINLFSELLEEFLDFKKQNRQRANIFERRVREAELGKAKSESARNAVNKILKVVCKGHSIPEIVKLLLKNVWSHVMLLEHLKDNQEGWKRKIKVAQLLVWSVQPIHHAARLEKLTSKVPLLVKSLRKGMDNISFSPIESTHLFEQLETCHRELIEVARKAINQQSEEEILRLPANNATFYSPLNDLGALDRDSNEKSLIDGSSESKGIESKGTETSDVELDFEEIVIEDVGFSRIETGESLTQAAVEPVHIDTSVTQTIEQLRAGSWVELKIENEFNRCKLAARIVTTGKYIFVNRSGMKMAEFLTIDLCRYLQLGKMKILDDEAMFDRALESVIANLRSMKARA